MGQARRKGTFEQRKAAALAQPHASEAVLAAMKAARKPKRTLNQALFQAAVMGRAPIPMRGAVKRTTTRH